MDLSKLIVKSKETTIEFDGMEGFDVTIAYLTKEELSAIRTKCLKRGSWNRAANAPVEELDSDLFEKLYFKAILKGWVGLTAEYINLLMPIDLSQMEGDEIEFTTDNAHILMKNSDEFDTWISEKVSNLTNFTNSGK